MPVPNRSRNKDGRFRKKRKDTHQKTLEKTYDGSITENRDDKHLYNILKEM